MRPHRLQTNGRILWPHLAMAIIALFIGSLTACTNTQSPNSSGLSCISDSPSCVKRRIATLNALNADKKRRWIKQPSNAKAYASGVRLFAYRHKLKQLTCAELSHGRREATGAKASLRAPGAGLTPAQISRSMMLAKDVGRDLSREYRRRCKTVPRGSN